VTRLLLALLAVTCCAAAPRRVALTKVFDCMPGAVTAGNVKLTAGAGELRAEGKDKFGRQWRWTAPIELRCAVFQADLDANRTPDLLVLMSTRLESLLFDSRGQPLPWPVAGAFADAEGLPRLVDLNRDRRAELVHTIDFEDFSLATLYEARGARWQQVRGLFARRRYPLVSGRAPSRPPFVPDESNAYPADQPATTIERIQHPWMQLADNRRCKVPALIFVQSGTRIIFAPGDDAATLERIRDARLPVHLTGRREPGVCSPAYLWAGAK